MLKRMRMADEKDPESWIELGTATVSDALDRLGVVGQCEGILPLDPSMRFAGPAFTVRYGPCGFDKGTVGDYVDDIPKDAVVVLDNSGRLDVTVWGDILTEVAVRRSLAGTVIDGICRDSAVARELNYNICSRSRWMRTGKDRVQVEGVQSVVTIGKVRVMPSDWVLADGDGVLFVPSKMILQVFELARVIGIAEEKIRGLVRDGITLTEARRQIGYHTLQRRQ